MSRRQDPAGLRIAARRPASRPSPALPPVIERLRAETRPQHDRLEALLALTGPDLTCRRYVAVLERFFGFWASWEPVVAAALGEPGFLAPRCRTGLLVRDLSRLGRDAAAIAALPRCPPLPLDCKAAALGSIYVMEGSTLGGVAMMQHLAARTGLQPGQDGCLYFGGYGAATGAMWAAFRARLQETAAGEADAIVAAAAATFGLLERWLPAAIA